MIFFKSQCHYCKVVQVRKLSLPSNPLPHSLFILFLQVKLEASGKVSRPKMCAKEIVKVLTPTTLRPASSDRRVVKAPDKVMDDFLEVHIYIYTSG